MEFFGVGIAGPRFDRPGRGELIEQCAEAGGIEAACAEQAIGFHAGSCMAGGLVCCQCQCGQSRVGWQTPQGWA